MSDNELRIDRLRGAPVVARRHDVVVRFARWGFPRRYLFFLVNDLGALAADLAFLPWSGRRLPPLYGGRTGRLEDLGSA